MKKNSLLVFTTLCLLAMSCKKESTNNDDPSTGDPRLVQLDKIKTDHVNSLKSTFTFSNTNSQTFYTSQGTKLFIEKDVFVDASGNVINGNVEIEFVDIYATKDMILSNMVTQTTDTNVLESNGEFILSAKYNGQYVFQDQTKDIIIKTSPPFSSNTALMTGWNGVVDTDGRTVWQPDVNGTVVDSAYLNAYYLSIQGEIGDVLRNCDRLPPGPTVSAQFNNTNSDILANCFLRLTSFSNSCLGFRYFTPVSGVRVLENEDFDFIAYGFDSNLNFYYTVVTGLNSGSGYNGNIVWIQGTFADFEALL